VIFKKSATHALLNEILGRIARIESTVNFLYDNLEFQGQGLDIFVLSKKLISVRKKREFKRGFELKNPKVTVIIPVSRELDIVKKSIDSVTTQTYTNFELILVSESPRSDLKKYLDKINDKRISFVLNHQFSPVTGDWAKWASSGGKSRTLGMKYATGEFFTFLDDDDQMLPNKLNDCVNFAQLNKYEVVGHLNGNIVNGTVKPIGINKVGKTRYFLGGAVDYLGLGSNTIFMHKFFLEIAWPLFNYKNLRGNDSVFVRMVFALNPKYGFLPRILTIKN
jgi:glycosyltransferase involved in cell wall biosynthesis